MGSACIKSKVKAKKTQPPLKSAFGNYNQNRFVVKISKKYRKSLGIIYEVKSSLEVSRDHLL